MLFKKNWRLQSALGRAFVTLTKVRFLANKFQSQPSAQQVRAGQARRTLKWSIALMLWQ